HGEPNDGRPSGGDAVSERSERTISTSLVVVVTGGASGIGRGIALAFARRGDDLAICDVNEERLAATVAELEALGVGVLGRRCDVTSDAEVDAFRDAVVERFRHGGV